MWREVSEKLRRIFSKHDIPASFNPKRTKHPNATEWHHVQSAVQRGVCRPPYRRDKQQLHKRMAKHRRASSAPISQGKGTLRNVHILDREDRWFERGVKEALYVKPEKSSMNRGGGLRYHLPSTYNLALSLLVRFHNHSHL